MKIPDRCLHTFRNDGVFPIFSAMLRLLVIVVFVLASACGNGDEEYRAVGSWNASHITNSRAHAVFSLPSDSVDYIHEGTLTLEFALNLNNDSTFVLIDEYEVVHKGVYSIKDSSLELRLREQRFWSFQITEMADDQMQLTAPFVRFYFNENDSTTFVTLDNTVFQLKRN